MPCSSADLTRRCPKQRPRAKTRSNLTPNDRPPHRIMRKESFPNDSVGTGSASPAGIPREMTACPCRSGPRHSSTAARQADPNFQEATSMCCHCNRFFGGVGIGRLSDLHSCGVTAAMEQCGCCRNQHHSCNCCHPKHCQHQDDHHSSHRDREDCCSPCREREEHCVSESHRERSDNYTTTRSGSCGC